MKNYLILPALIAGILSVTLAFAQETGGDHVAKQFQDHLVKLDNGEVKDFTPADLDDKEYLALYYSAHWCPPCRAFTPSLSEFYTATAADGDANYELVFISSDKDAGAMKEYMEWGKMQFPAVKYDDRDAIQTVKEHSPQGIPHLVVLDKTGKVVASSVEDGQYVGCNKPLSKLKELAK